MGPSWVPGAESTRLINMRDGYSLFTTGQDETPFLPFAYLPTQLSPLLQGANVPDAATLLFGLETTFCLSFVLSSSVFPKSGYFILHEASLSSSSSSYSALDRLCLHL